LRPEIHYPITPLLQVKSRGRALEKRSIEVFRICWTCRYVHVNLIHG